jgi:hypothetical protein
MCMTLVSRGSLGVARGILETARPWEDSADAHPFTLRAFRWAARISIC